MIDLSTFLLWAAGVIVGVIVAAWALGALMARRNEAAAGAVTPDEAEALQVAGVVARAW